MNKPYELPITPIHLPCFFYDVATRTLSAEASSLGGAFQVTRLFDDACDVGIAIQSHHTGRVERFYLRRVLRDRNEQEVQGWVFGPVDVTSNKIKEVVIFND